MAAGKKKDKEEVREQMESEGKIMAAGGVRIEALLVKRLLSPEFLSYGSRFLDCKQWKQTR